MFKVGQRVFVKPWGTGTKGTIVEIDDIDMDMPYKVELPNSDGEMVRVWFFDSEVEAKRAATK